MGSHRLDAWRPQTLVGTEVDPLLVDEDLLRCRHPPAAGQQRLQLFDAENVTGRVTRARWKGWRDEGGLRDSGGCHMIEWLPREAIDGAKGNRTRGRGGPDGAPSACGEVGVSTKLSIQRVLPGISS